MRFRDDALLARTLAAAGLPATGQYAAKGGWVSRAWIGDEYVVRRTTGTLQDPYAHDALVVGLLAGSAVPHARHVAHGNDADGSWSVSERLPGRTLQEAWPAADPRTRRSVIESLGDALRALHRVPVPADLVPPWLAEALDGGPWPAYHPPVVRSASRLVEDVRRAGRGAGLLADVANWVGERMSLFDRDQFVLVHGDLHGSNVMVDGGRVTGLIDFAEAVAQPADVELDTILRWCARPQEFPSTPDGRGLEPGSLVEVPGWLRGAYPELFVHEHHDDRLDFYDMWVELAILAHHPDAEVRRTAEGRVGAIVDGRGRGFRVRDKPVS